MKVPFKRIGLPSPFSPHVGSQEYLRMQHGVTEDGILNVIAPLLNARGERFPIARIATVKDENSFLEQASSIRPYESVFGYEMEKFTATTIEGSVFLRDGEFINMTNSTNLVFRQITSPPCFRENQNSRHWQIARLYREKTT